MAVAAIPPQRWEDIAAAEALIGAVDLFPPEMLAEMAATCLEGAEELWLDAEGGAGFAYAAPARLTDGTWNLLLLAVDPERQGQGLGRRLVAAVKAALVARGARLLLVETSGVPGSAGIRPSFRKLGFRREARIRDYYQTGDDKVIFAKPLSG